jgi:SAM-dependent methyltransferase
MSVKNCDNLSISPWISRFSPLVTSGGDMLDLAAGSGRHSALLLEQGHHVTAIDRSVDGLKQLRTTLDAAARSRLEIIEADLEDGSPWPLRTRRFDAVVVVNYLHRPLWPSILSALVPGGLLLYETYAVGHEAFGKPSNPDFLLRPGELLDVVYGRLQVVAFEQGLVDGERGQAVKQRIAAISAKGPDALTPV